MLVKDLDGIMFEKQKVTIRVFDMGEMVDEAIKTSFSYAKRIYGDLEVIGMFDMLTESGPVIVLYLSFPEP